MKIFIALSAICCSQVFAQCEDGWSFVEDTQSCFKKFDHVADYHEAVSFCNAQGAQVPVLKDKGESEFVRDLAVKGAKDWHDMPFMGLTNMKKDCNWVWNDGTPLDNNVVQFAKGEPNNCHLLKCVFLKWNDEGIDILDDNGCATKQNRVICQKKAEEPVKGCEEGWSYFKKAESCYKAVHDVDFDSAKKGCQELDAHVTSIHSKEENDHIVDMLTTNKTVPMESMAWIGLILDGETWKWTDQTEVDYLNWYKDAPGDMGYKQHCTQLYTDVREKEDASFFRQWNDQGCQHKLKNAICKKTAKIIN